MPSRGMKKLRQVEKIGLVVLCIAMLATLGVGMGPALRGCGHDDTVGSFEIEGDEVVIDQANYRQYHSYLSFQNLVLRVPPPWKYAISLRYYGIDPQFRDYQAKDEDLWTFIVLDHLAQRAGVEVPPQAIAQWIRRQFSDREGNYDRANYEAWVRSVGGLWATAADFEKMLGMYLRVTYYISLYDPLLRPGTEEIYQNWRLRNKRHDVRFVVQDLGPIRSELDPSEFTEEKLSKFYEKPMVRSGFRIPTKRSFEAAYLVPGELSTEELDRLRDVAKTEELVAVGPDDAFRYYYANQKDYPIDPIVDRLRKEWEEEQKKKKEEEPKKEEETPPKEDAGDAGKPADAPGGESGTEEEKPGGDEEKPGGGDPKEDAGAGEEEPDGGGEGEAAPDGEGEGEGEKKIEMPAVPDVFVDPTKEMTPREKFDEYFAERVERELFVERLLDRLLKEVRVKKNASLEELAKKYGLAYKKTGEPLDDYAIGDLEKIGGPGLRVALSAFSGGRKNEFGKEVVKVGEGDERSFVLFRLLEVVDAHYPEPGTELTDDIVRKAVRRRLIGVPFGEIEELPAREALRKAFPEVDIPEKEVWTTLDVLRLLYRQERAEEIAKERLDELRSLVTGGEQTFEAAAAEKGYEIRTLVGISQATPERKLVKAAEGESLTPEQEAENRRREEENFILKGRAAGRQGNLQAIDKTEALRFVEDILVDRKTDAAYLVYVDAHRIPDAEEMPTVDASRLRVELQDREKRSTLRRFFDFKLLKEEYRIHVPYLDKREDTDKKAAGGQPGT